VHTGPPISLPLQLRALNALLPLARGIGAFEIREDPSWYEEKARQRTGLHDFGDYDLRSPLTRLLYTLKHETHLSLFGRIGVHSMIGRNLDNNLLATQAFRDHPELVDVDVDAPIIIVCTPRTGSTLLHNLLACHARVRAPRMWELHRPCPPPRPEREADDPRIRASDREFGMYYRLVPEMRAIHFFRPLGIEECIHLFGNNFTCRTSFTTMANITSYTRWVMAHDLTAAYRNYRKNLQILKLHYPDRRLVLKSPAHLLCLRELAAVFPRAKVVHLHRDPVSAAGSFCSLTEAVQITLRNEVDVAEIGRTWDQIWTPALLGADAIQRQTGMEVLHLNYTDLVTDPRGTARRVFQSFGWSIPETLDERINAYLEANPKGRYGRHTYDLRRYGLESHALYAQTAPYIERFEVPREH